MSLDRFAPAIFVLLWSTGWVVAKYAALHSEPFTFLAVRYALSALAFFSLCLVMRAAWPGRAVAFKAIYSGAFLHGFYLAGLWWAIANGVPAGISGIIAALQPLLTAMAAPLLVGERLQGVQRLGLLLGFLGIAIAISPKLVDPATADLAHAALPLAINLSPCVPSLTEHSIRKSICRPATFCRSPRLQYVGALIVTLPLMLTFERMHFDASAQAIAALIWSVFGPIDGWRRTAALSHPSRSGLAGGFAHLSDAANGGARGLYRFRRAADAALILGTVVVVAGVYLTNRPASDAFTRYGRNEARLDIARLKRRSGFHPGLSR